MRPLRLLSAGLALGLLAAACVNKGLGSEAAGQTISSYTGSYSVVEIPQGKRRTRPAWSGKTFDGNPISASGVRGSVTVVNFWASWCGPCHAEQPTLEAVWRDYRDRGVRFVGVNIRDTEAGARSFLDLYDVTYPSVHNYDAGIAHKFRTLFVPSTYIVDEQGYVAAKILGATLDAESLGKLLDAELA